MSNSGDHRSVPDGDWNHPVHPAHHLVVLQMVVLR